MSNRAVILACSRYFLSCPRPHLIEARETKVAEGDLATGFNKVTFARGDFV